ncbi:MAG: 30S ribosomal protein S3ae, partial [Thermoplasmatales archaeon]|nr:30S ribosomal protein S3ae [Thermoplasmatales archaeon]
MAKARARSASRKVKDKWRAKNWYQILAPTLFDSAPVSETLS